MSCIKGKTRRDEQYGVNYAEEWAKWHEATAHYYHDLFWRQYHQYYYNYWAHQGTDIFFDKRN